MKMTNNFDWTMVNILELLSNRQKLKIKRATLTTYEQRKRSLVQRWLVERIAMILLARQVMVVSWRRQY